MRLLLKTMFVVLTAPFGCAQNSIPKALDMYNEHTVPYITTTELAKTEVEFLLDTRQKKEYQVSHLKNALWVGYDEFDLTEVRNTIKNNETPIVVYCSIGVRSEAIGEKLISAGYTNVKNLYGGIFEWKNSGFPVYDSAERETNKVHPYNRIWGRLLTNADKSYKP
ncbi:rhodanese-like domain-containing protein [Arenibacter sp. GZD96]|uniref:rhodanese-like domain-containing protein n=1 Tax=Aurantibrevibacter litoralis TaxID=3106030 RepID=UPI002B003A7A|nr:rhodanese-like domain-containing protein [Arenibacter sp. GZD-96]MEA1785587.1 rhodanese-like domain-containing protein [Arenibacter sp. GZD-96]